jgi:phage shock protein A
MALINRISRLFQADFHAVLDRIEEPEQLLRQAIRDMEEELAASEQQVKLRNHEQQVLATRISELREQLAELDSELDLCFASNKEDLARSSVRRKLEVQRLLKQLSTKETANASFLVEQGKQLEENRAALEGLKQKADIFAARPCGNPGPGTGEAGWMARELVVTENEIEVAFLREQEARRAS